MNIFDVIGPVMVGPSSSHTAGAVRIGYAALFERHFGKDDGACGTVAWRRTD